MTLAILGRPARFTAALLGLVGALCMVLSDEVKAGWIAPVAATAVEARVEEPQVAVDAAGNTTVVWTSGTAPNRSIRSAFRPAGGSWEPSFARMTSTFDCHDPHLAVNPSGAAALVAECEEPAAIRAAYRPSTSWNGALEIPGSGSGNAPRVGIDAAGNATAVWSGPSSTVFASYRTPTVGWSSGTQISEPGRITLNPNLAMSGAGYAHALWREERKGYVGDPVIEVKYSRRSPGASGTWTAPFRLSDNFGAGSTTPVAAGEPQVEIGVNGQRMMAWSQLGTKEAMAERTSSGDLFSINEPVKFISEVGSNVEDPQIAVDGTGLGIATWRSDEASVFPIKAATTAFINGSWAAPQTLSGPTNCCTEPTVAADPAGTATVVWSLGSNVNAASRPAGGSFMPTTVISSPSHPGFLRPEVEMTTAGDSLVVWASGANHVAIAVNDVSPPSVAAGTPAPVEVGQPVALTATATDTWSPVSLSWSFGDGDTATGAAVSHTYASAGNKLATVTATDGAGNSSTSTVAVVVSAPPGSGGGGDSGGSGGSGAGGGGGQTARHRIKVSGLAVAQPWAKQAKAKAIQVKCRLDVKGTCGAVATVTKAVAKKLGLAVPKARKPVRIGSGSAPATAGRFAVVKVKLSAKALAAIAGSAKPVVVAIALAGTAAGNDPGTAKRGLTLHP